MAVNQTSPQNQDAVYIGSAQILYSTNNGSSFTDLGVAQGITITENVTKLDATPDNGIKPERAKGIASQTANVVFTLWEIDPDKIDTLRGGIDTKTTTAGTPVSGGSQVVASGDWSYNVPIELSGQESDGTQPTINSVTGGTDGALVLNTDYTVQKIGGLWHVTILDSVTVTTESQTITFNTDYTPAASTTLSTGGLVTQTPIWIRLKNKTDEDATTWAILQYDFYSCTINVGDSITYQSKDDTDSVTKYPVDMLAEADSSRTEGDQLFKRTFTTEAK